MTLQTVRDFLDSLAQGRVGMHVARDLFRRQFGRTSQGQLGQQFGDIMSDHMRAQDLAIFLVTDNFDKSASVAHAPRLWHWLGRGNLAT